MAHLINSLDVREINHALLGILKEARALRGTAKAQERPAQATSVITPEGSGSGGGSSSGSSAQDVSLHVIAANRDGSIQVDGDGYAVMKVITVLEPM